MWGGQEEERGCGGRGEGVLVLCASTGRKRCLGRKATLTTFNRLLKYSPSKSMLHAAETLLRELYFL